MIDINITCSNLRVKNEIRQIFTETLVSIPKLIYDTFVLKNQEDYELQNFPITNIKIKDLSKDGSNIYNLVLTTNDKETPKDKDFINYKYDVEIDLNKMRLRLHESDNDFYDEYIIKDGIYHLRTIYYTDKNNNILERKYTVKGKDYKTVTSDNIKFKHYVFILHNKDFETKINIFLEASETLNIQAFKEFLLNENMDNVYSPQNELQIKIFLWLRFSNYQIFAVRMNNDLFKFENEEKREKVMTKRRDYES